MNASPLSHLAAIVAMSENGVIGVRNQLPWKLPADLRHFKAITTGHSILMGRKTYESIGRPLPNRTNIILTRNPNYHAPGCTIITSLDAALNTTQPLFIIGGAEVYERCMPHVSRLYLTVIHHTFQGDAYFPALDQDKWQPIVTEHHAADEENNYAYSFFELIRKF